VATDKGNGGGGKSGGAARVATLGVFALGMIEVTAVLSIRNYPSMAEEGWSMIGWYVLALLLFFLPLSLAGAELATGWPKGGGVYAWVREAFGERNGFIAIWSEWTENVVWFPTVLSFISGTFAYAVSASLGNDRLYNIVVMLAVFWGVTALNFLGEKYGSVISTWGGIFGVILPSAMLVVLLLVFIFQGNGPVVPFSASAMLPDFEPSTLPFVATVILLFAGMEMAGFHALETRDPARDFPRAILISATLIFCLSVLGTLAILYTVPDKDLSLAAGVIQAIQAMLDRIGAGWLTAPMAILIGVGSIAQLSTWLAGPAKGLGVAAAQGDLPPVWRRHNTHQAPVAVLIIQAVISSAFALAFVLLPSVNSAYWVLSAVTTEVLIIMYFFMFAAVIKLRYSQPDTPRAYRIPGGTTGVWIVAGVAIVALAFSFFVGLLPPSVVKNIGAVPYAILLAALSIGLSVGAPLVIWIFRKPQWIAPNAAAYLETGEDAPPPEAAPATPSQGGTS
jgi:amino acid transporter